MADKNSSLADTLTDKQEQLTSQKKVLELDIDKRIFLLEESMEKLKTSFMEADELNELKDSFARIKEMKGKLREMEDVGFITKLETIQTQDEVLALTDDQATLKRKLDLLSNAIKIISTKMPGSSKDAGFMLKKDADDVDNVELSVRSLKSDIDLLKKRLDASGSDPNVPAPKTAELEAKFYSIESEFKKFITDVRKDLERKDEELKSLTSALKSGVDNSGSVANVGSVMEEINSLRNIVDKVESLVKAANDGVRGVECQLDESNKKVSLRLNEQDKLILKRVDSLEEQAGFLAEMKARVEEFDVQITDLANKWSAFESIKGQLLKRGSGGSNTDYARYVPVLKENVSKLYRVYNRAEKRISEIEAGMNEIRAMKTGNNQQGVPVPSGWEEMIKSSVDSELTDVVENINALSDDIKSRLETGARMQSSLIDTMKADYEGKISSLKMDIDEISKRKRVQSAKSGNYEEFADFKARMLAELDDLRREMKGFEKKVSSELLDNIVENKLVPHVSNQDKIAKSLTLLNRKVDQGHIDVSKNAHEKITSSVQPIMDKISEIENDVSLLKDTKANLVDDVNQVLERIRVNDEVKGVLPQEIMQKYDERFLELAGKIESLQARVGVPGAEWEQKINALQYESDVLRQELQRVKELYFEMLEKEKSMPVIIE